MKTIITILITIVVNVGYSQFEVSTIENSEGIKKIAGCNSISNSTYAKNSRIILGKTDWGTLYMEFYYQSRGLTLVDAQNEIVFVFYDASNNKKHTYYTSTDGYQKVGNGYWLFIYDKKLISYFKKYSYTYAIIEDKTLGTFKYKFSLKGFTKACAEIMK